MVNPQKSGRARAGVLTLENQLHQAPWGVFTNFIPWDCSIPGIIRNVPARMKSDYPSYPQNIPWRTKLRNIRENAKSLDLFIV